MAEPRRLATADDGFESAFARLIAFESTQDEGVERATAEILEAVRASGDPALLELTARFDGWNPRSAAELEVPMASAREALQELGE
ncbi:MAG: histidinol dehydrogenase, partial [Burkholderiales bacterium]|nr:histidinol dehydrogenase [Burkholderiales bacterium]